MSSPDDRSDAEPQLEPGGTSLYDVDRTELAARLGPGPTYRVDQVWEGLYAQQRFPAEMTNLPTSIRARLDRELPAALEPLVESHSDDGATIKWLHRLYDGEQIEAVLMHYDRRSTVCVSTQAGCAMACGFCATGQGGFRRHLSSGEILEQVIRAARAAAPTRLSNVVFMGMGEPLANLDAVWAAVERLHADIGLSARNLTISTVGLVPGIERLAEASLPVNLAVSLHAANDTLRDRLVPINRRYPLDALMQACATYFATKRRRVSFEWAMIADTNDRAADVDELASLARPLRAHVNLIPLNPTPGYPTVGSTPDRVAWFCDELTRRGVPATIRQNRGTDIDAACGQLRAASQPVTIPTRDRPV